MQLAKQKKKKKVYVWGDGGQISKKWSELMCKVPYYLVFLSTTKPYELAHEKGKVVEITA